MRLLRRSGTSAAAATGSGGSDATQEVGRQSEGGRTTGKGRPTPKRRDAQTRRRVPAPPPPRTQREAARLARANRPGRDERRRQAAERRERMAAGDDRVLMPRDRGQVKAYIRDVVDSRPHLMGLFMPLALLVLVSVVLPIPAAQQFLSLFSLIALVTMIVEGVLLGLRVTRMTRAKFPKEQVGTAGTGWYAFTRASQLRRLRVPKPRVERGANV